MIVETAGVGPGRVVPVEVKSSATATPPMARGIRLLASDLEDQVAAGYVVYLGDRRLPLGGGVTALPLAEL